MRALDGGVHATAEAAAEARDLLALRVGAADPLDGLGVRALNFPARLGAYLQRLPPDVATRVAAAAAAQTNFSGSGRGSPPPPLPWRPSSTSPQPLLQHQARLSPRPPGQQPQQPGRSMGSPGGSVDHAGPTGGAGPAGPPGAGGPVPFGSGGNAAVQLVRQLQQLQQLQLLHQQQNQLVRDDAETHPTSDKAQLQQQQLQQQQLQQHQQQLQMMFSPARMSQVLAAMQAQAAGSTTASPNTSATPTAAGPTIGGAAAAPPLPCDELLGLLPGATSYNAARAQGNVSGFGRESSSSDGHEGSQSVSLDALPLHGNTNAKGPRGSSSMGYAHNAASLLAAPLGAVRAALPFGGSRSNSDHQEGGQGVGPSSSGEGSTSATGKREAEPADGRARDGSREDTAEVKRPRI